MTGEMKVREMQESDREAVMRIFNHYALTSFAAYPNGPLPPQFFMLLREGALSAVVLEDGGGVAGFGLLKPFLPFPVFRKTGMLTYFLAPQEVGKGLGGRLLDQLAEDAKKKGMTMLVANMSNEKRSKHPLPQDPWVFRGRKHCRCRRKIRGSVRSTLDAENGGVNRLPDVAVRFLCVNHATRTTAPLFRAVVMIVVPPPCSFMNDMAACPIPVIPVSPTA